MRQNTLGSNQEHESRTVVKDEENSLVRKNEWQESISRWAIQTTSYEINRRIELGESQEVKAGPR